MTDHDCKCSGASSCGSNPIEAAATAATATASTSRRDFLCAVAGCVAAATASGCSDATHTALFREHLREMSRDEVTTMLKDLEREYAAKFGKEVKVGMAGAKAGVDLGYALDIGRCTGCRECVHACVAENNQDRATSIQWIRVLEMDKSKGVDFEHADPYYDAAQVPQPGKFYLPMACMHCRNAPCVKSCPVGATWQEPDGIVVIDYDWCIGCRCCMASCPYGARHFNWQEPEVPKDQLNPDTHYLGNRPRPKGVVEKCTFCIQRVRSGRYPACVEACPVGARKFGNMLDPDSEIRWVLENKRVFVLKSEFNTQPRFYYFVG